MFWSTGIISLMGATVTQGASVTCPADAFAENADFLRIQLINPARTLLEITGSQRYTAK